MKKSTKKVFLFILISVLAVTAYKFLAERKQGQDSAINSAETLRSSEISVNNIDDTRTLMLINSDYRLEKAVDGFQTVSAYKIVPLSTSSIVLNENALNSINDWFDKAKDNGFEDFFVSSGYRSFDEQQEIYKNSEDKSFVQTAGASEHQSGFAADISVMGIGGNQLDSTKEGKWLAKTAWEFGFILRYPKDKTDITKISFEPWHFRYVGQPHAYFIYENGLCFEEYIEYLKANDGYSVVLDEISYSVYYCESKNDIIKIPMNCDYEISSDNTGGFIVTAKEIVK